MATASVEATPITLDLTTDGIGGDLETSPFNHTFSGVTITASPTGGVINATSTSLGVDGTVTGEDADQVDSAETLTFTFAFAPPTTVSLTEINFAGVGANGAGDDAIVTVGGSTYNLATGATDFNGSTDIWTPSGGITLSSGDTIVFEAQTAVGLEGITLDVVPEPAAGLLAVFGIVTLIVQRRRRLS